MNIRPSTGFSSPSPSFGPRSGGGLDERRRGQLRYGVAPEKEGWHVAGLTMKYRPGRRVLPVMLRQGRR